MVKVSVIHDKGERIFEESDLAVGSVVKYRKDSIEVQTFINGKASGEKILPIFHKMIVECFKRVADSEMEYLVLMIAIKTLLNEEIDKIMEDNELDPIKEIAKMWKK